MTTTETTPALFRRFGEPFTGRASRDDKGKPFTTEPRICDRCGGQGGSEAWKFTGYTCFKCGGHRTLGTRVVKLYTAEQLTKVNARAAKAAEKRVAKAAAAAAAAQAEADARRVAFLAEHGALLDRAAPFAESNSFVGDVSRKARERCQLTEGQAVALAEAVARLEAQAAVRAASRHVGTVGERLRDVPVTVERVATFERQSFRSWATEIVQITTLRTAEGAAIVVKSPTFRPREGERFALTATVKEHGDYKGEAQTIVSRATTKPLAEAA